MSSSVDDIKPHVHTRIAQSVVYKIIFWDLLCSMETLVWLLVASWEIHECDSKQDWHSPVYSGHLEYIGIHCSIFLYICAWL